MPSEQRIRELDDIKTQFFANVSHELRTPLIALTGYGQESDRRRSREAGFHGHLVKPVDLDAVEAALKPASA